MNVKATVEVNVRQVFSLLVFILAVNSIRDAMTLNFGDLNARARDPAATSGLIKPVDEANGRVSPKASIRYSTKVSNANSLWVILSLRVRSILESYPISGLPSGLQYAYYRGANQADACYYFNLQVD